MKRPITSVSPSWARSNFMMGATVFRYPFAVFAVAVLLGGAPIAAGAQPAKEGETKSSPAVSSTAQVDSSYVLGQGDSVAISLVGRNDLNSRVRVSTDGTILLPFVGRIVASGRTVLELAEDVRQALVKGGFFADAVVQAEVVGISSRYATVLGFVGSPGLIPLDRNYRLSEMLARVGGRSSGGADYVVLTRGDGTSNRYQVDVLASSTGENDPLVAAGDKIFIPSADSEVFYISGQVTAPGSFPLTKGLTFRQAIAKGGGVNENGSEKKLKVVRNGATVKKVKLDDLVQVGDMITIGERLF